MKKLVLTSVCALAMAGAAFAQGNLQWNAFSAGAIRAQTNSTILSPLFGGGTTGTGAVGYTVASSTGQTYYYELLYFTAPTISQVSGASAPSNSFAALFGGGWADTGGQAINGPSGSLVGNPAVPGLTVNGMSTSISNEIILVGWSSNLGTTWASASNVLANWNYSIAGAFFGVSTAGYIEPAPTTASPGATVFGSTGTSQGLPIFNTSMQMYLLPVPEPATLALAGLGGLSLMLFRRQRK